MVKYRVKISFHGLFTCFYENALELVVQTRWKNRVENVSKCQDHLASLSTRSSIRKRAFPLLGVGAAS